MGTQLRDMLPGTRVETRRRRMGRPGTRTLIVWDHRRAGWISRLPQRSGAFGWTGRQSEKLGCGQGHRLARLVCCGGPYLRLG